MKVMRGVSGFTWRATRPLAVSNTSTVGKARPLVGSGIQHGSMPTSVAGLVRGTEAEVEHARTARAQTDDLACDDVAVHVVEHELAAARSRRLARDVVLPADDVEADRLVGVDADDAEGRRLRNRVDGMGRSCRCRQGDGRSGRDRANLHRSLLEGSKRRLPLGGRPQVDPITDPASASKDAIGRRKGSPPRRRAERDRAGVASGAARRGTRAPCASRA